MTLKDYMRQNDNTNVKILRQYSETSDWAHCLYEGPLHDAPSWLRKEEVKGVEHAATYANKTFIFLQKSREVFQVNIKFASDLQDIMQARAAEYGYGIGRYIKMLVEKDLEAASKNV